MLDLRCPVCNGPRRSHAPVQEEIDRLQRAMGVAQPVRVQAARSHVMAMAVDLPPGMDPSTTFQSGFTYIDDDGTHRIVVNIGLCARCAAHTIIHEMRHAWQKERMGVEGMAVAYQRAEQVHGYNDNPYERDAERTAAELAPCYRLVKEV